ncbi:MAG: hypothetical protein M3430_14945 [Acidobacteriota bacterium]|nr:hypothetical protein [Acidobacteriota bacterium]
MPASNTTAPARRRSDAVALIRRACGDVLFALRTSESCEEIDTACQVEIERALTRAHSDMEAAEQIVKGDARPADRANTGGQAQA